MFGGSGYSSGSVDANGRFVAGGGSVSANRNSGFRNGKELHV